MVFVDCVSLETFQFPKQHWWPRKSVWYKHFLIVNCSECWNCDLSEGVPPREGQKTSSCSSHHHFGGGEKSCSFSFWGSRTMILLHIIHSSMLLDYCWCSFLLSNTYKELAMLSGRRMIYNLWDTIYRFSVLGGEEIQHAARRYLASRHHKNMLGITKHSSSMLEYHTRPIQLAETSATQCGCTANFVAIHSYGFQYSLVDAIS